MKIVQGNTYICENGFQVTVRKNSLPYYKFSSSQDSAVDENGEIVSCSEVWTEDGIAYHSDCGYNIISKIIA